MNVRLTSLSHHMVKARHWCARVKSLYSALPTFGSTDTREAVHSSLSSIWKMTVTGSNRTVALPFEAMGEVFTSDWHAGLDWLKWLWPKWKMLSFCIMAVTDSLIGLYIYIYIYICECDQCRHWILELNLYNIPPSQAWSVWFNSCHSVTQRWTLPCHASGRKIHPAFAEESEEGPGHVRFPRTPKLWMGRSDLWVLVSGQWFPDVLLI